MAKQKGQGQGQGDDLFFNIILGIFAALLLAFLVWNSSHTTIAKFLLFLWRAELSLFTLFSSDAASLRAWLSGLDPSAVSSSSLAEISGEVGRFSRWIFAPLLVASGVFVFLYSPLERFKKKYTMQSLTIQESTIWPEISPIARKNLVLGKITEGPWAVSMTENEFATKYKLIDQNLKLDKVKTSKVFIRQLGPLWRGDKGLPKHRRAIFAAFATRIAGKPDEALARFRSLAKSHANGAPDYSWVDEAINNYGQNEIVLAIQNRHAYALTVFATMLQISRADGVLASSMFVWVKEIDRMLWYVLNGVGRYAFFVESCGVMAHWLFEKEAGHMMIQPCVDSAVEGFETALAEYCKDDAKERLFK